jgi:outer membrane lipoprotein carrier protein
MVSPWKSLACRRWSPLKCINKFEKKVWGTHIRALSSHFFRLSSLLLLVNIAVAAQAPLPPILAEVESTYAKAGTIFAQFEQVNESAALKTKKKSTGRIALKRPNKLRWETLSPDANLLVSDGKRAWFYTPPFDPSEHGQYSEYPASRIQSKLANSLLSGDFSSNRDLKIQEISEHEFVLTPKSGTAGTVKEARVEINPSKKTITRVQLIHDDGNRSDIHLTEIKLGEKFGDDMFVFKAPPNTDRLQE